MNKLNYDYLNDSSTYPPVGTFHYCVHITGYGGRVAVGQIPSSIAKYWNGVDRDELVRHHVLNNRRFDLDLNDNVIDPNFTTKHWYEVDNVVSELGPVVEGEPDLVIEQAGFEIFKGRVGRGPLKKIATRPVVPQFDQSSSCMMAHTADVVSLAFCLDVAGKFNPRKLKIRSTVWGGGVSVISGLSYDGKEAKQTGLECLPYDPDQAVMGIVMNDNDLQQ